MLWLSTSWWWRCAKQLCRGRRRTLSDRRLRLKLGLELLNLGFQTAGLLFRRLELGLQRGDLKRGAHLAQGSTAGDRLANPHRWRLSTSWGRRWRWWRHGRHRWWNEAARAKGAPLPIGRDGARVQSVVLSDHMAGAPLRRKREAVRGLTIGQKWRACAATAGISGRGGGGLRYALPAAYSEEGQDTIQEVWLPLLRLLRRKVGHDFGRARSI